MGAVIKLPLKVRPDPDCGSCNHAFIGMTGIYCGMHREEIWLSSVASECAEYEPNDDQ